MRIRGDSDSIRGEVAFVTGASSGLGWHCAVRLAERGARVVAHGRDEARLADLVRRTGAQTVCGDLSDPADVTRIAKEAENVHGRVDLLVNNAGFGWAGNALAMNADQVGDLLAVNLAAPIRLAQLLAPGMVERRHGRVAFVSSIAGRTGVAGEAVYASTKAGVDMFAESLRLELDGTGVDVAVFVPGVVDTRFFERRNAPYGRRRPRPLPAAQVADALVRAAVRGEDAYRPRWLRLPVTVRAVAPGSYRRLAARFGGSG